MDIGIKVQKSQKFLAGFFYATRFLELFYIFRKCVLYIATVCNAARKVKSSQIFPVCHGGPKPALAPPPPIGTYIPTGRGSVYGIGYAGKLKTKQAI